VFPTRYKFGMKDVVDLVAFEDVRDELIMRACEQRIADKMDGAHFIGSGILSDVYYDDDEDVLIVELE